MNHSKSARAREQAAQAWKGNGALDWGPVKRLRQMEVRLSARTSDSTVRRISRDAAGQGHAEDAA